MSANTVETFRTHVAESAKMFTDGDVAMYGRAVIEAMEGADKWRALLSEQDVEQDGKRVTRLYFAGLTADMWQDAAGNWTTSDVQDITYDQNGRKRVNKSMRQTKIIEGRAECLSAFSKRCRNYFLSLLAERKNTYAADGVVTNAAATEIIAAKDAALAAKDAEAAAQAARIAELEARLAQQDAAATPAGKNKK
jgi:hypothetical protein